MGCPIAQGLFVCLCSFNHVKKPSKFDYEIPYNRLTSSDDEEVMGKNFSKVARRLEKLFRENSFWLGILDPEGFRYERVRTDRGMVFKLIVRLRPDAKKLLVVMTSKQLNIEQKLRGFTSVDERRLLVARDKSVSHCFSTKAIINLYLLLRQHQWQPKKEVGFTISLEDLRKRLGCTNYSWSDIKKRVILPAQKEMAEDWTCFEYELIRSGRGGKVTAVRFIVKSDNTMKAALGMNERQAWEFELLKFLNSSPGFVGRALQILETIKALIASGARVLPNRDYCWNADYVLNCIKVGKRHQRDGEQGKVGRNGKKHPKVQNLVAYTYNGMMKGLWIDECEDLRRIQERKEAQRQLDDADALMSLQQDILRKKEPFREEAKEKSKQTKKEKHPPQQTTTEPPPIRAEEKEPEPLESVTVSLPPEPPPNVPPETLEEKRRAAEAEVTERLRVEYEGKKAYFNLKGKEITYSFEEFLESRIGHKKR